MPFVDVTAGRMLVATHEELRTHGVRLVLARDVGQVRDVLRCITQEGDLTTSYPKIDAAVEALADVHPARSPVGPDAPSERPCTSERRRSTARAERRAAPAAHAPYGASSRSRRAALAPAARRRAGSELPRTACQHVRLPARGHRLAGVAPQIEVVSGVRSWRVELLAERTAVGKAAENDIAIDEDPTASGLHAVLERFAAGWCVTDLGSANGTWGNGARIWASRRLRNGDEIRIGQTRLVFRDPLAARGSPDAACAGVRTRQAPPEALPPGARERSTRACDRSAPDDRGTSRLPRPTPARRCPAHANCGGARGAARLRASAAVLPRDRGEHVR